MMMRAKVTLDLDNATIESVSNRLANQLMALAGTSFVLLFLVLAFFALNWILSLFMSFSRSILGIGLVLTTGALFGASIQLHRHQNLEKETRYPLRITGASQETTSVAEEASDRLGPNAPPLILAQEPIRVGGEVAPQKRSKTSPRSIRRQPYKLASKVR